MHTNVIQYMRELDDEMEQIDQQIALLQLKKYRLQETRLTVMQVAEDRAARLGQASPFGTLPHGNIVLRDARAQPEPAVPQLTGHVMNGIASPHQPHQRKKSHPRYATREEAAEAKKARDHEAYERRKAARPEGYVKKHSGGWGPRVRATRADSGVPKRYAAGAAAAMRERLLGALEKRSEPVWPVDLIASLQITDPTEKSRLYNGLTNLVKAGLAHRVEEQGYLLVRS